MTPESLARMIAKAMHGTDAHWAHYVGAAEAVLAQVLADPDEETIAAILKPYSKYEMDRYDVLHVIRSLRALAAQQDGAQ